MTIRLAWSNAKVGFVFSQRGVVMEAASSFFLPRLIGHSKALYITLPQSIVSETNKNRYLTTTGSVLPASSPHFGDLFHELLPSPESVLPRAVELASQIASQTSTVSTYLIREMMWRGPTSAEGAHLLDSELIVQLYDLEDKNEGFRAFLEKRKPVFKGDLRSGIPENVPWWEEVDVRVKRERSKL
jgi:enoyl-CoA hydratase/carnithine racemase